MYAYTCCRCTNCAAQIVLEEQGGWDTNLFRRPPRPRARREACPYCRTVFVPKPITSQKAKRLFCSKHSLLW